MSHTTNKQKTKTKEPQQNMLSQVMSHTTNKQKTKTKEQQNMLNQVMSHKTSKQKQNNTTGYAIQNPRVFMLRYCVITFRNDCILFILKMVEGRSI